MKWINWKFLTAFLWSWSLALMVFSTVFDSTVLAHWSILVALLGGTCSGGVLIEVERRRVEHIVDMLLARAQSHADLPRIGKPDE